MRVVPEIDIMNGHCVKQGKGSYQYTEIISHSPRKIAKMWEEQGASYLHIRDLDGLAAGHIMNHEAIRKLIQAVSIPVEIYGGIYSLKEVENILSLGADRVVVDQNQSNVNFLKDAVNSFGPERIAIHIHSGRGLQQNRQDGKYSIVDLAETLKKVLSLGISCIECENISENAFGLIADLDYLEHIIYEPGINLMVSGGIATVKELESLHNIGVYGVILGDALYERHIELKQAIELFDKGVNINE